MVNMKKYILCLVILSFFMSACARMPEEKGIRIGTYSLANSLDPTYRNDGRDVLRYGIGETLLRKNNDGEVTPWLISSLQKIDEKTWQIHLRSDVRFSNGEWLTPRMVVRNLQRIAQYHPQAHYLLEARYEVFGYRIFLHLSKERPQLAEDLSEPHMVMLDLDATTDFVKNPIGTGPYRIEEFYIGKSLSLVKNLYYWQQEVKNERVFIQKLNDEEALSLLQKKKIDVFLEGEKHLQEDVGDSFYHWHKSFLAREAFLDYSLYHVPYRLRESIVAFLSQEQEIDVVKKQLQEMGYEDGEDGYIQKEGEVLTLFLRYEASPFLREYVSEIKEQLSLLAIESVYEEREVFDLSLDYDIALFEEYSVDRQNSFVYFENLLRQKKIPDNYTVNRLIQSLAYVEDTEEKQEILQALKQEIREKRIALKKDYRYTCFSPRIENLIVDPWEMYLLDANTSLR